MSIPTVFTSLLERTVKIELLRNRINESLTLITQLNAQSPEEKEKALIASSKQAEKEAFNSPQNQDVMQQIASQFGGGNEGKNPFDKLKTLMTQIENGEMDGELHQVVNNVQKRLSSQTPYSTADVIGSLLERNYHLYNSHALMLLVVVQLALDIHYEDAVERYLAEAEAYIQSHSGWINSRVEAYRHYTHARRYVAQKAFKDAHKAFAAAVKGWYFSPHSMIEVAWSPLDTNAEILEQTVQSAIELGETSRAFAYVELARDANWNSEKLYGVYSSETLDAEDQALKKQLEQLKAMAEKTARGRGDAERFVQSLQKGKTKAKQSTRYEFSSSLVLLFEAEALADWLDSENLGRFVERVITQANSHQAFRLRQDRRAFLAQQIGEKVAVRKRPEDSKIDADSALILSEQIRSHLPVDTLLVSIWMGRETTYIFAVDKKEVRAHVLSSADIIRKFNQFNRKRLYNPRHGYRLYEQLLAPYLNESYQRLMVVSNGVLQNAPFAAFSTASDDHEWLGDQYLIRTAPRARQLIAQPSAHPDAWQALVLDGSSVPNQAELSVEAEIDAVFTHFKGKRVNSEELKKSKVIELLPRYPLVHFAGHSVLKEDIPAYSSMKLYGEEMYLAELQQLELGNIGLMVLGSCESAETKNTVYGDGFSSLQESLHNAGVDAVVATLHKVDDELSSVLMSRFYEMLAKGMEKDKALQAAQQAARDSVEEHEEVKHKNDWAAYVLSGSNEAL